MAESSVPGKPSWRRHLPVLTIVLLAILGSFTLGDYLSFEALRDNRDKLLAYRDAHFGLTVFFYVFFYVLIVAFFLPGAVFATLAGGFLFGLWIGTFLTVLAATVGASLLFVAARHGFGDVLSRKMEAKGGAIKKIKDGIEANQWSMLLLMRLVPVVPFFLANLIPAFMRVPLWTYVLTTFVGIIPGTFVYNSIGAGLGEVFARGETPDLGIILEPHVIGPLLGLAALSMLPVLLKAVTGRKGL